jgi:Ca2+-binding RTX toxin-like protein
MIDSQYFQVVQSQLTQFAARSNFNTLMATAFGNNTNKTQLQQLRQQWLSGNFSIIPNIQVLSQASLGAANGAYAVGLDSIFLSADFLATASIDRIAAVIIEEVGHRIDQLLNGGIDSAGDEGEIFSRLVNGENLSTSTLVTLKSQNDHGVIVIEGRSIAVENNTATGTLGNDLLTAATNINVTAGNDVINALAGNDTVDGGAGNDLIDGGVGNDAIFGGLGNDTLLGGEGNDIIDGDTGQDSMNGGNGIDTINYL